MMAEGSGTPGRGVVPLDEFVRLVERRGRSLHWLVGAGVSFPAGVPTATELIYEFKRTLYAQRERVPRSALDLRSPDVQERLDSYFARLSEFPPPGAPEEYAGFFEAVYGDAGDRARFVREKISRAGSQPVHGHIVLAGMWHLQKLHTVWTTNFDDVLEQAAVEVSVKAGWLTVADLDSPSRALDGLLEPSRPLLVKMHGDFRSERLDNITSELLNADNKLRRALSEAMRTHGLVVVGYSGRDESVMNALQAALEADHPYRAGLYWVKREGSSLLPRVVELLDAAATAGVDARVVECGGFEELMKDVELLLEPDDDLATVFDRFQPRERRSAFERLPIGGRWPKLRLNAVAVADYPRTARLVDGKGLGNTRDTREAIAKAGVEAIVARRREGVVAFGEDSDLLKAFAGSSPRLDWVQLDPFASHQDSSTMGFLYEALALALARGTGLVHYRRRREHRLRVDGASREDPRFSTLRRALSGRMTGVIPEIGGSWAEAVRLRLEYRYGTLWLIYAPIVWYETSEEKEVNLARREWTREYQVKRYNRQYTALLKGWADVLCDGQRQIEVSCLSVRSGANGTFTLKRIAPVTDRHAT